MPKSARLAQRIKERGTKLNEPLWKGPEDSSDMGGITQSMLNNFIGNCRERFRLKYIEGWQPTEKFNNRLFYGNLWHFVEEDVAQGGNWKLAAHMYAKEQADVYRFDTEEIDKYYNAFLVQYPVYVDYWTSHPEAVERRVLVAEEVFKVPYELPSGRVVYLRGKWDSVSVVKKQKQWLLEVADHKTKSEISRNRIERRLKLDIQLMFYAVALDNWQILGKHLEQFRKTWYKGLAIPITAQYNVIRRPFSGGKGSIKKGEAKQLKSGFKKAESQKDFNDRLRVYFVEEPEEWFARWDVLITNREIEDFQLKCLNPILEELVAWYDWIVHSQEKKLTPFSIGGRSHHWIQPFGIYSALAETGVTDMDEMLLEGSTVGLHKVKTLFNELQ